MLHEATARAGLRLPAVRDQCRGEYALAMSSEEPVHARLDRLAEEFLAAQREGDSPSISGYARAHPDLAEEIEGLFPLLIDLEGSAPTTEPAHEQLGDYKLLREIGRGGMGVVHEAFQVKLGRRVALKVLPPQMTADPRFLDRFRLEAQAAARLQHRNVVPVIDWGEHEGIFYYTMQYVDGCGLDEVLEGVRELSTGGPFAEGSASSADTLAARMLSGGWRTEEGPSDTTPRNTRAIAGRAYHDSVASLLLQAAEGIAAAHANGVLHRDVKPSNLLLDESGTLWVTDFGLCKDTSEEGLTQPGDLLGTFRYMAPERFEGVSDVQGDVYGLGITLYELLTRRPAYEGDDRAAIAAQVTQAAPPSPRRIDPGIPRDLEWIVRKAIHRERIARYATADALAADLRAYLAQEPISARAPSLAYLLGSAIRRHKSVALIGAAAVIALVASTAYYIADVKEKEAEARFRQYIANIAAADTALRDRDSPLARQLLQEAPEDYRNWEWHHLNSRLDRSLRSFERWKWGVQIVRHSPNGRHLATVAANQIRVHDEQGGDIIGTLHCRTHVRALAWHPSSTAIAVGTLAGWEVWSWPEQTRIVDVQLGAIRGVAYSPDGEQLALGGHDGRLRVVAVESGNEVFGATLNSQIHSVAFDDAGSHVAAGCWDAHISVYGLTEGTRLWRKRCGKTGVQSVAFVDEVIAAPSSDGHVELRRTTTGELVRVLGHEDQPRHVAASADGSRLLVGAGRLLHLWDPHTGTRLLTYGNDSRTLSGSFHPDSTRVVTGSARGSVLEWATPESGDPDIVLGGFRNIEELAFSPTGSHFVVGAQVLRVFDAATHEETRNWIGHTAPVNCVGFSPDGDLVASGDFAGEVIIWHVPTDSLAQRFKAVTGATLTNNSAVADLCFSRDSSQLFTAGVDGGLSAFDVNSGELLWRLDHPNMPLLSVAVSPDGRWLAVGEHDGVVRILRASDRSVVATCSGHTGLVQDLLFLPGKSLLASASWDRTVRLWEVPGGTLHRTLRAFEADSAGAADALFTLSCLPDASRILSACADGTARLWDLSSGRLVATLRGSDAGWMHSARFSPDASRLVTVEDGGTARVWSTQPLRDRLRAHQPDPDVAARAAAAYASHAASAESPDEVIRAIRRDGGLSARVREAALRRAYRERASEHALMDRCWRVFLSSEDGDLTRKITWAIVRDLYARDHHEGIQNNERFTLFALGAYRCGAYERAVRPQRLSLQINRRAEPGLHAIDLAVASMSLMKLERATEARKWLAKLEDHVAVHPAIRESRGVASLLTEARQLVR